MNGSEPRWSSRGSAARTTYTLTLNAYGDWIPAEQYADDLPEPPAPAKPAALPDNVINLFARQAK